MARGSFKKLLLNRIQDEREHRGVSGAAIFQDRSEPAPNPRHMVAFSSDDLPALRSGRRHGHAGPGVGTGAGAPAPASPPVPPPERPGS